MTKTNSTSRNISSQIGITLAICAIVFLLMFAMATYFSYFA